MGVQTCALPIWPIPVQVNPPWWASNTARAGYAIAMLLASALFALAYRARLRRRHAFELAEQRRELAEQSSLANTRFLASSEERPVGNECISTGRSRWSQSL